MMFLWLPLLAMFVLAFAYFALLCVIELRRHPRSNGHTAHHKSPPAKPLESVKRLTSELRFMTREMSPLFGFGDD